MNTTLECLVCFEIAEVPTMMYAELHLICPECRLVYVDKPKRHRYAEKEVEELSRLNTERQELSKNSQS